MPTVTQALAAIEDVGDRDPDNPAPIIARHMIAAGLRVPDPEAVRYFPGRCPMAAYLTLIVGEPVSVGLFNAHLRDLRDGIVSIHPMGAHARRFVGDFDLALIDGVFVAAGA